MSKSEEHSAVHIKELHRKFIAPSVEAGFDVVLVKGSGTKLWDVQGKEYIDCLSGVGVLNVGHCHPKVVGAVREQITQLTHVTTMYFTEPMVKLAEKLSEIAPMERGKVKKSFFVSSGTEANEHAITLAKKYTKRPEILSLQGAFHGRGGITMSITGIGAWRAGLGPFMPGTLQAPSYHCYRCSLGYEKVGPPECGYACARYIESMLRTQFSLPPAVFVAEPIQGVAAVPAPPDYFKVVKEILDKYGILLLCDEVQTGFGRTGKMFGIEHYGVEPDIISMAKGMGGGFPIGAYTAKSEVADSFEGPDFSTFGGNPVSCRAALANIEVIEEENLVENAGRVGDKVLARFQEFSGRSRIMDDVQGRGLMITMEIVENKLTRKPADPELVMQITRKCADEGILIGKGGQFQNRLRISPPLSMKQQEADHVVEVMEEAISSMEGAIFRAS